jgi:hypothetical protein
VRSIEIVKNGQVERTVSVAEAVRSGCVGRVSFKESGWFVVRTIVEHPKTFRFAQTAPYYVEIGKHKRRISKASAEFFQDGTVERSQQIGRVGNLTQRQELLEQLARAKEFWEDRVAQASAP